MTNHSDKEVVNFLKQYKSDATDLSLDQKISQLDIDSIDLVSLVCDIEDSYGIAINLDEIDMESTLRAFVMGISGGAKQVAG